MSENENNYKCIFFCLPYKIVDRRTTKRVNLAEAAIISVSRQVIIVIILVVKVMNPLQKVHVTCRKQDSLGNLPSYCCFVHVKQSNLALYIVSKALLYTSLKTLPENTGPPKDSYSCNTITRKYGYGHMHCESS